MNKFDGYQLRALVGRANAENDNLLNQALKFYISTDFHNGRAETRRSLSSLRFSQRQVQGQSVFACASSSAARLLSPNARERPASVEYILVCRPDHVARTALATQNDDRTVILRDCPALNSETSEAGLLCGSEQLNDTVGFTPDGVGSAEKGSPRRSLFCWLPWLRF